MGAVIVLVVVTGLVSAVSLAVARHGSRAVPEAPTHDPAVPPSLPRPRGPRRAADPGRSHASARPRKPPRYPTRRDPSPAGRRRVRGPLAALSAVETRGRLARLDAVTFVEGAHDTAAAPGRTDGAGAPVPRGDQAVVTPEPAVAFEAAAAPAARKLRAPCQIVRVEQVGPGTVIDLVTLGPCDVGGEAVPAGTPLALGFGPVPSGAACQDLEAVMGYWEAIGAVVDLEVAESPQATRYRFDCREDGLALLVQSERP